MTLEDLAALAKRELSQLNFPAAAWVPPANGPDGRPLLDALVVGGGMCGQTAAFALMGEGVRHLRCVDKAPRGREGPWATYARMETLRSPKHLTGPDLGVAALTYRAWHEAKYGTEHWEKLHKVWRLDWAEYLLWVRDTAGVQVENAVEVASLIPSSQYVQVDIKGQQPVFARKVVLALGRDGSGSPRWPRLATFDPEKREGRSVFHSADAIDFKSLKGKTVGILGGGASAFDNAGEALEAGAAKVAMFLRRPFLPQVNKSKWTAFPGFQHGYSSLDDAQRWRFYAYIFSEQVPPPYESVQRCEKHKGFSIRFGEGWDDVVFSSNKPVVKTNKGETAFDALIVATGFDVNLTDRDEVAPFRHLIDTWSMHIGAEEAAKFPEESRFPYLGDSFQLRSGNPEAARGLGRIHVFNWGATMSHGALAGDIPGLEIGARRLATGIARDLFLEDADLHWARLQAHNEDEMKPTGYYVPPGER